MDFQWYGSLAGIIGATMLIVQILKRFAGNWSGFENVPTWVYSVVVAVLLASASKYFGLLTEAGTWLEVITQAVMLAGSASGFWTWLDNPTKPIGDSGPAVSARVNSAVPIILIALIVGGSTGCALFGANATEPERPIAATGIAIQEGLTTARTTTTELFNTKAYPFNGADAQDRYERVLGYFREAAVAGNTLADALAIYTAQPTDTNAQKVTAAFSTLNTKWPSITKELGGDSLPGKLVLVVAEVNKLMEQVRKAFAKPSARRQQEVLAWV
jgi:hypothetical protein